MMSVDLGGRRIIKKKIIEAIVGEFKVRSQWEWVTMAVGAILCPLAGLNLFALLDMPLTVPSVDWLGDIIGAILTGVVVSRGADYLLVLWGRVASLEQVAPSAVTGDITLPAGATTGLPAAEGKSGYHIDTKEGGADA
jgi:hypothetical protein